MEQQTRQPPALSGCIALVLLGLIVWWCFVRIPSSPNTTTLPTSKLSPEELREHRQTFSTIVEPQLKEYRSLFLKAIQGWQLIFRDLAKGRISRLQAYELLHKLEKIAKALQTFSWTIPESLPDDVYKLLQEARIQYSTAAYSFVNAIQQAKEYLDTDSAKAYTLANEHIDAVNESLAHTEQAINNAKKKLGFK